MAGNSAQAGRSVTSKITAILLTFTQGHEHSLTEIARLAGLPISTAHRLTAELASLQLLERTEDGLYRVGRPLRSGDHANGEPGCALSSLTEHAARVLDDLCAVTKTPARLGTLHGLEVAYIERQPGRRSSSFTCTAQTVPAHPTAIGRALLAFSPRPVVETVLHEGLRAYTPHTITSPERFRRAIAVTQLTRVAITRGELEPGVCGVAMPVFATGGEVVAAIELTVDHLGDGFDPLLAVLTIATRSLSRELAGEVSDSELPRSDAPEPALATTGGGPGSRAAE